MKQVAFFICFLPIVPAFPDSHKIDASFLQNYDVAIIIYDRSSGTTIKTDSALCARRLSPCSTFKIYNTLIGLELGLIRGADTPWYKWDGVRRDIDAWNRDLTLREAFVSSAVPAYQILARQIGNERMKEYIEKINYGTKDISAGIDVFWLNPSKGTPIMISADEQVVILNKLFDGKLPFAERDVAILRDIMKVAASEKGTIYGKTGSGRNTDGKGGLGWFVGFLESKGATYVFACNITGGKKTTGKVAQAIVEDVLRSKDLF
jgi:beta-lactamase class D